MADNELHSYVMRIPEIAQDTEHLFDRISKFQEIMMMYGCATREVRTKLEVLNDDFSVRYKRNPIEIIKTRVKQPLSLFQKINRRGLAVEENTLLNEIQDIAGVRVICSFIDDIYEVARLLVGQDDITLLNVKDYIRDPKPNGYRSLHLIIQVPVFFADHAQKMTVEVQIRKLAIEYWTSLEHEMHYKKDDPLANAAEIEEELRQCAETIAETDKRLQAIRMKIRGEEKYDKKDFSDLTKELGSMFAPSVGEE